MRFPVDQFFCKGIAPRKRILSRTIKYKCNVYLMELKLQFESFWFESKRISSIFSRDNSPRKLLSVKCLFLSPGCLLCLISDAQKQKNNQWLRCCLSHSLPVSVKLSVELNTDCKQCVSAIFAASISHTGYQCSWYQTINCRQLMLILL